MTAELFASCARAVHVLTASGEVLRAGEAVLFVLSRLETRLRPWAQLAAATPLRLWVEAGYWLVSKHRGRLSRWLR
jgi:hypothetical protein